MSELEFVKVVVVPFGSKISDGVAKEVCFSGSPMINDARQAYIKLESNINVITQPATSKEYYDFSSGKAIKPNQDIRTVDQVAQAISFREFI